MRQTLPIMKTVELIDLVPTGHELRQRRLEKGLTLEDIAEALATNVMRIQRLEKGTLPTTPEFIKEVEKMIATRKAKR